jgi:glycosyltransferase involved in cell wall biosynthesis
MKKIVICSNTSWYIYNFRRGLLEALSNIGYKIYILAPRDDYSKRLEDLGYSFYHIDINNKGTNPAEDLQLIYMYFKLLKEINPDILLTYTIKPNIYASFASKLLKIKTINVIAGLGTVFLDNSTSSKIARSLYKLAFKDNSVIFENRDDYEEFIKRGIIEPKQATVVLGSGIDTSSARPKNMPREDNSLKFLFIARLIRDKGIVEYINAIRELKPKYPNVKFQVLGSFYFDNPSAISKDEFNSWIEEGLIEYLGYTDKVLDEIDKVDCIVLPSYREGLSRVLLEAGSMAKPIITTDVTGCREVVDDGVNGYLVPVKDSKALAVAMEKMINLSKRERDLMGQRGRVKIIEEFDDSIVISKYLKVIENRKTQENRYLFKT